MDLALLCDRGCEDIAAIDVKELVGKAAEPRAGYVVVRGCSAQDAAVLNDGSQAASRVVAIIHEGDKDDLEAATKALGAFDFSPFDKDGTFKVYSLERGEQDKHELECRFGDAVETLTANMASPGLVVIVNITETVLVGVDLSGRDLGKREYKAFHMRRALRGTLAYCACRLAGFAGKEALVDPYANDGTIPIEAGLLATRVSPQRYRRDYAMLTMPFAKENDWPAFFKRRDAKTNEDTNVTGFFPQIRLLQMGKANAKLAGVEKMTRLTRAEPINIDLKLERASVDCFVTTPLMSGKNTPPKLAEAMQDELFKQAELLLKKKGTLVLIAMKKAELLNAAQRYGFGLTAERSVEMGESQVLFLSFARI